MKKLCLHEADDAWGLEGLEMSAGNPIQKPAKIPKWFKQWIFYLIFKVMKSYPYICSFLVIAINCNKVITHPKGWRDEKELKGISHGLVKCGWERVPSLYLPMPRGSRGWDSCLQRQPHKGPHGGWKRVTRSLHPYTVPPKGSYQSSLSSWPTTQFRA